MHKSLRYIFHLSFMSTKTEHNFSFFQQSVVHTTTTARIKNGRKREMIVCSSKLCNYGVVESREDDNSSITSRAKIKKLCHKNKQNYN